MHSTLIETKVTPWSWPWRAPCTIDKVRHHKEDEKKGQQTSDLILEGGLHAPHPALSFGIYISSQIPLYTPLDKESTLQRQ
ncbi:hypothetical protein PFLUV_G00214560 [Perca fluviatilis]|uniref:Uncharacterized protein n=1 Tax=Perca fluviatilis TaxID=8168 RepID=A0A6A5E302_PERFL|nr:hypothetical protein PFLUV_G00214560 [Perca fluviatilis]